MKTLSPIMGLRAVACLAAAFISLSLAGEQLTVALAIR